LLRNLLISHLGPHQLESADLQTSFFSEDLSLAKYHDFEKMVFILVLVDTGDVGCETV
jgi:hypothetical protein